MSLLLLVGVMSASAEEYPYLSFQTSDGSIVSFGVESLTMTVADGKLLVQNGDGSRTFDLGSLSRMFFASDASGIDEAVVPESEGKKRVYTMSGVYMGSFDSVSDASGKLGRGMYLIKDNNNTTKFVVR